MREISLKDLLAAGCHFGHKTTRWHPKAASFIYQPREGVHIIDLVKTRDWLKKAAEFVYELGKQGKIVLYVASKRQAKGVVTELAKKAGLPYMTNRWIGGFITNWDEVKKNIDKMNTWRKELKDGIWEQQYPKHEIVKLTKHLRQVEAIYSGVGEINKLPDAIFIIDINKEDTALKEAIRREIPTIAIVDTNTDPSLIDYAIPANDDAVGSIQYVVAYITDAYIEGRKIGQKADLKKTITDNKDKAIEKENKEPVETKSKPAKKKSASAKKATARQVKKASKK